MSARDSDGACAMILTTREKAKKLPNKSSLHPLGGILLRREGALVGIAGPRYHERGSLHQAGCVDAARGLRNAGIKDPRKEIDLAEPYAPFAHQLIMFYERLLLCNPGEAPSILESGSMELDGALPVCPSGGVISTNAIGASALERIAEAAPCRSWASRASARPRKTYTQPWPTDGAAR